MADLSTDAAIPGPGAASGASPAGISGNDAAGGDGQAGGAPFDWNIILGRGDILMGAATPNHVNDPIVSGVWRPRNRGSYFTDDPMGNIVSVGGFKGDIAGVSELWNLGKAGTIAANCILTSTYHITSASIATPGKLAEVERDVIAPLVSLRSAGQVVLTDFTSLVSTWRNQYSATGCLYQQ